MSGRDERDNPDNWPDGAPWLADERCEGGCGACGTTWAADQELPCPRCAPAPADREALVEEVARALRVAAQDGDDRLDNATDEEWDEVYDSTLQIIAVVARVITEVSGTPENIARAVLGAIDEARS